MKFRSMIVALSLTVAAPAFAQDLTVTIDNMSSMALAQFFTSPADVDEWEEDIFGDDILPSGSSIDVTIADGREQCVYDLKFVMESGQEIVGTQDMCEEPIFTLSDN